ncbi:MAG: diaminopimelate epimerase [Bacteroidetes bacterium]|nr:diaminopimelate epimerase [Bacteroidota bacterium]
MRIEFSKYQGTGNDFVILDNRDGQYNFLTEAQIAFLCYRRFGIGADGLMMLQQRDGYDFEMKYFNADGKEGSMCGNGGRCIVQFARDLNIIQDATRFIASDGPHNALITDEGWIELNMIDVNGIEKRENVSILNTGSPHFIQPVTGLDSLDVETLGKSIRYSDEFINSGINVNFIEPLADGLHIRTYERGVEAETLSCGTGATAAALSVATVSPNPQTIVMQTRGGKLEIKFLHTQEHQFSDIRLCGPAKFVFSGVIAL